MGSECGGERKQKFLPLTEVETPQLILILFRTIHFVPSVDSFLRCFPKKIQEARLTLEGGTDSVSVPVSP